jgi:hypothetical protein
MADKNWRDEVFNDLCKEGYLAIESLGLLTERDIRATMDAVRQTEANRDEAEEWAHIRRLQRERENRLSGDKAN